MEEGIKGIGLALAGSLIFVVLLPKIIKFIDSHKELDYMDRDVVEIVEKYNKLPDY